MVVWVNLTLLSQYADSKGLDKDKAVKQKISYATKKVKANALIAKRLSPDRGFGRSIV